MEVITTKKMERIWYMAFAVVFNTIGFNYSELAKSSARRQKQERIYLYTFNQN